mmetsp:Transcript_45726/g.111455  ORF Transcript_45726/g.111455 Transcript_45726/m.111455 type:complete len:378 (+) Transcript_45726:417-1550(+)
MFKSYINNGNQILIFSFHLEFTIVEVTHVFVSSSTGSTRVDVSHDGVGHLLDLLHLLVVVLLVGFGVFVHPVQSFIEHVLKLLLVLGRNVVGNTLLVILESVLEVVKVRFKSVTGVDSILDLLIFLGEGLGLLDHALDLFFGKTSLLGSDGNLLGLSSSLILGRNLEDTVSIDLEGDLNLRNTTGGWGDTGQFELSKLVVILGHGTFSFVNLDQNDILVVLVSRECLGFLGGDGSTAVDELGHDTTDSFDTLGKRSNIQQKNLACCVTTFSGKDTSLDGSSVGDSLVGVDTLGWLFSTEVFRDKLLNLRNTSRSTDQNNLIDLALAQVSIFHDTGDRSHGLLEKIVVQFLETGTGQCFTQVVSFGQVLNFQTGLLLR